MLPPVLAVVSTSAASPRPAPVAADTLGSLPTIALDDKLALALAADAELEGRLNILLLAARERMFDSLAAVINALSDALNLPKDADETGSAYALRLADAIVGLTKPQLAGLEQQLQGAAPMPPLALVAAALNDPTGDAAAQIVAYLEVVRYREKDLATKAVVSSYGMNGGAAEAQDAAAPMPQLPARMVAQPDPQAQAPRPAAPSPAPETPVVSKALSLLAAEAEAPAVEATAETFRKPAGAPPAEDAPAPERAAAEPARIKTTADPRIPPSPADADPAPQADASDRLKAVVQRAIASVGPDLLDIMADRDHMVETVLAQALVADMLDDQDMATRPKDADTQPAVRPDRQQTASLPEDEIAPDSPATARPSASAALATAALAAPQQPLPPPPAVALGVPFAVAQYLPREDEPADEPAIAIDRIDPDEEDRGGRQQQASDEDEGGRQADDEDEEADDDLPASAGVTPAFGMYRRMADWE